jgi:hypothetical protein
MKFYIVLIKSDENIGRYRMSAISEEQAGQRAQTCFWHEFGTTGEVESIQVVG